MAKTNRLKGCYHRVLLFLFVIATIVLAAGFILHQRVGGTEGSRYWMAGRALDNVEKHLLENRPDGIPQLHVESQFEKVRSANTEQRVDLLELHRILRDYQNRFQKIKPSTPEVVEFLTNLEATNLLDDNE